MVYCTSAGALWVDFWLLFIINRTTEKTNLSVAENFSFFSHHIATNILLHKFSYKLIYHIYDIV